MRISFAVVDVFATKPLTGNPLALVPDADGLPDDVMRAVAREFNQSETTFLLRPTLPGADRRLRSFTPTGEEVGGAGHNALGAWLWLAESEAAGPGDYTQEIGGRALPVRVDLAPDGAPLVSMAQAAPRFGRTAGDREALAAALGLVEADLEGGPAQVVDTGAGHLMVPVRDRAAVDRARPDAGRLIAALRTVEGEGAYVFSVEEAGDGATAYARFFNPSMGIWEDPATGTAAGPLAALLVERELSPAGTLHIEQGHALRRPSRLAVTVTGAEVTLTGTGLTVAEGTLRV
ncbi:PhzF family phenazine biosynthesis protein [Streptomyces sp. 8L]|uniref:PhzF family phenazine biosynthesis protein n=1 Tax=Streptomyces sp. 8L TaxID=2877242 RepID=UPI001CD7A5E8|nr:PhzF family phenazine biosynthesis protein [Streptomyces sp. 8L]MCA1219146.1 PhzF family phenazine biosynthesis protein [Streptomyces sp. 8L]